MASLAEKISILTDPTPRVLDLEDDDIDSAKVNKKYSGHRSDETLFASSALRSKAGAVLQDNYAEYSGGKVSRKSLSEFFHDDEKKFSKYDVESDDLSSEIDEDLVPDESEGQDDEEELNDSDLENFKSSVKKQSQSSDETSEEEDDAGCESSCSESNEDLTNKFSNIDVMNEMEKGAAVKAQQEIWFRLSEARIKLQKLLSVSNRLPQSDCWGIFKKNIDKDKVQCITKGSNSIKYLLNNLLNLQSEILHKNVELSNVNQDTGKQSDEEIPSDTEDEIEDQTENSEGSAKKPLKRKLKCEEYGEIVAKRYKSLLPYRNSVIGKWDEKTKLSSGRITQKSFKVFDSSAIKQIEEILQDETRLIKRTQLKRSLYKILGKSEETKPKEKPEENESISKQDMLLKDYDTEIFDDDDFYRQLLRDVVDSKSVGIGSIFLRKQMEIQEIRNKIKKKVDTKASKGRKIRYDVHPKLPGYFKHLPPPTTPDDVRDNYFKTIFGKVCTGP